MHKTSVKLFKNSLWHHSYISIQFGIECEAVQLFEMNAELKIEKKKQSKIHSKYLNNKCEIHIEQTKVVLKFP